MYLYRMTWQHDDFGDFQAWYRTLRGAKAAAKELDGQRLVFGPDIEKVKIDLREDKVVAFLNLYATSENSNPHGLEVGT